MTHDFEPVECKTHAGCFTTTAGKVETSCLEKRPCHQGGYH